MHAAASLVNSLTRHALIETDHTASALQELTTDLARGDDAAWAQFHRDYGPGIFRRLLAATHGDHDLASEALQQTYLRIARYARPCNIAPMFASWLRIVANSALNDCRRRRRTFWDLLRRNHAATAAEFEPADAAGGDAVSDALDHALAQLAERDRALLEQKYFHGDDVRTLATRLDLSPKAVESRLTRARAELRRLLVASLKRHE